MIHAGTTNDGELDRAAVRAMLDAMAGTGRPFLYTSGVWVLGDTGGRLVDETAPVNPVKLVAWRPAMEQMVLAARGVRAIVIRPGVVYGHGGGIPVSSCNRFASPASRAMSARARTIGRWSMLRIWPICTFAR